ncbi:MAG TPA: PDZ domain-containing protein, partial [Holophaga sp.]|nr:PDZ domain-containing protein [Holophaga sp.]
MHPRTWLALLTLPLVGTFTVPLLQQAGPAPKAESKAPQDPLAGLSDIQDVLALVRDNYVDPPDLEKVLGGGIQGALERAHPLNSYLSPEDLRLPDPGPAETGLRLFKRGIYALVVGVVPGSPAQRAGIQVGDVVRKLEGESIGPLGSWHLERRLRGPVGSELALHRYAATSAQVTRVVLKRERLARPALAVRRDGTDLVVGLPDLSEGRAAELAAVLSAQGSGARLILDLRSCHGGRFQEGAKVAGLLLGSGPFA